MPVFKVTDELAATPLKAFPLRGALSKGFEALASVPELWSRLGQHWPEIWKTEARTNLLLETTDPVDKSMPARTLRTWNVGVQIAAVDTPLTKPTKAAGRNWASADVFPQVMGPTYISATVLSTMVYWMVELLQELEESVAETVPVLDDAVEAALTQLGVNWGVSNQLEVTHDDMS